jgi:hypothetical protein
MTRELIIQEFTDNIKDFKRMALNVSNRQDADDLFQECAVMLLEFSEERLISYYNPNHGLKPIWLRILVNQYKSKTSRFHKQYRKQEQFIQDKGADIVYNDQSTELDDFTVDMSELNTARDNVHRLNGEMFPSELEEMVFALYVDTGSLRKTLAAIDPEEVKKLSGKKSVELFDLKTVHEIVKKYRRTIRAFVSAAA